MSQPDTLIPSGVASSVGVPDEEGPPMPTTTTAKRRELLTYDDIEKITGGRIKARSFTRYQAEARTRERAGELRRTDMPAPVGFKPNPSAGLPDIPLFDGEAIRTWLRQTDRPVGAT